jgi:hypothetical protein
LEAAVTGARSAIAVRFALSAALLATASSAKAEDLVLPPLPDQPAVAVSAPRLGGYIQLRETIQKHAGLTASLNRVRLSANGTLPSRFAYRALVEFQAPAGRNAQATVSLREAIIRYAATPALALTVGQFKTPFSREYLLPVPVLETADFAAVVDSLSPKYDIGLMTETLIGPYATVNAGVFNGEGQNAVINRDSTVLWVGRIVVRPLSQLAIGGNVARDGPDSLRWGGEADIEVLGATVRSEYITRHRKGRAQRLDDEGWYVFAGYRVTPQVQLFGRAEEFERPAYGLSRRVRATTAGANWEPVPGRVRVLVQGMRRRTGVNLVRSDALIGQLQVRF